MSKGLIFSKVGNELEEFVDSLKYLHNRIRVKFYLKMHHYGAKLVIHATECSFWLAGCTVMLLAYFS